MENQNNERPREEVVIFDTLNDEARKHIESGGIAEISDTNQVIRHSASVKTVKADGGKGANTEEEHEEEIVERPLAKGYTHQNAYEERDREHHGIQLDECYRFNDRTLTQRGHF